MAILALEKCVGLASHAPNPSTPGAIELAEKKYKQKLWLLHRLDKDTSGLLLCATEAATAADMEAAFREQRVQKEYYFLSQGQADFVETEYQSKIYRKQQSWLSERASDVNAKTYFKKIRSAENSSLSLWLARPASGKTHQIRLHARDLGIPVWGDPLYSKDSAPRLFLHCARMQYQEQYFESPLPLSFHRAMDVASSNFLSLLCEWEYRQALMQLQELNSNSYRIYHKEHLPLSIDNYNGHWWISDFSSGEYDPDLQDFFSFCQPHGHAKSLLVRRMINRGKDPESQKRIHKQPPEKWQIYEHGVQIQLRSQQGQSAGIFLDQRENRAWVKQNTKDREVLNLFAYTCAFSLMAALGGAKRVISVDSSRASLEWGKENFNINALPINERAQFFAMETETFLKLSDKRGELFDLIICDPPSFARNKKSLFRIEKDWPSLLQACARRLRKGGHLLLSCNYEKWSQRDFLDISLSSLSTLGDWQSQGLAVPLDFEKAGQERILKTLLLQKLS